ncbi:MAG: PilZ domain-containing protein [Myxococcales bacterium]|nr:PilZ domain-containing protein [Myxococcales bacterium]
MNEPSLTPKRWTAVRDAERRRHVRRALYVPCRVMFGTEVISRRGLDLSPRGILVASNVVVAVGERVRLAIDLPLTRSSLRTSGRVARVVHGRRETDRERALAVDLEPMGEEVELFLAEYLRGIPVPFVD